MTWHYCDGMLKITKDGKVCLKCGAEYDKGYYGMVFYENTKPQKVNKCGAVVVV